MVKILTKTFLVAALAFVAISSVYAQEVGELEEVFIGDNPTDAELESILEAFGVPKEEVEQPEGVVSCFDNYVFGSVQADITSELSGTVPGTTMTFKTVLDNTNSYPIINGTLYIKVLRLRESGEKNVNGPDVVDQFIAIDGVTLDANSKRSFNFDWDVPAWIRGGDYQLVSFFISNKKYNLLGLSFTDDVVGNAAHFEIKTDSVAAVYFDKETVEINEESYNFAAFPPRIPNTDAVVITSVIKNTTDEDVNIPIKLKLHYWDGINGANKLKEEQQWVKISANSSEEVEFTITDKDYPVYLSEISLQYKDTKSILNARFVREGIDRLRINFPAVTKYPLVSGEEVDLFACIHNTSDNVVDGVLKLTILDENNNTIHSYEHAGGVGGDMMGLLSSFVPNSTYESFLIKAELFQDGKLIEEDIVRYNCKDFDNCSSDNRTGSDTSDPLDVIYIWTLIAGLILVIFIIIMSVLRIRNSNINKNQ